MTRLASTRSTRCCGCRWLYLGEVFPILRLGAGLIDFRAIDDPRRDVAVQLLRLRDASHLFSACAQLTEGRVTRFDLGKSARNTM